MKSFSNIKKTNRVSNNKFELSDFSTLNKKSIVKNNLKKILKNDIKAISKLQN